MTDSAIDEPGEISFQKNSPGIQSCVSHCLLASRTCLESAMSLLDRPRETRLIRDLLGCSVACGSFARCLIFGLRGLTSLAEATADLCDAVGRESQKLADDVEMRRCAEITRNCAEACRELAARKAA